jgi:hypothetical protein
MVADGLMRDRASARKAMIEFSVETVAIETVAGRQPTRNFRVLPDGWPSAVSRFMSVVPRLQAETGQKGGTARAFWQKSHPGPEE